MHLMDWEQEIMVTYYYECVSDCDELVGRCPPYICPLSSHSLSIESLWVDVLPIYVHYAAILCPQKACR